MQIVYLGLFSTVFNWVFDKILSPVIEFLAGILSSVLEWVFNAVLPFLLEEVFWPIFYAAIDLIMALLGDIFYLLMIELFEIVDALQVCFEVFSGVTDVTMNGMTGSLLEVIFLSSGVQQAVFAMILIGFALALGAAILSTIRSMGDLGEQKMPVSKVLNLTMKSVFYLVMIPTISVFIINVSSVVLRQVSAAVGGEDSRLSASVFVVASLDAANSAAYNISGVSASDKTKTATPLSNIGQGDTVRAPYYNLDNGYSYKSLSDVKKNFTPGSFDYLIGYGTSLFIMLALAMCIFNFISRIFEVILLVLVAPLFAALMPLDDGEKFKSWQEMFIGKLFGGYGTVIAMQLYLLIAPLVMAGNISFGDGSVEANYLIRLVFMVGSLWTMTKAGPIVTQLFSYQAGMAEQANNEAVKSAVKSVGSLAYGTGKNIKGKIKSSRANKAAEKEKAEKESRGEADEEQAFKGKGGGKGDGSPTKMAPTTARVGAPRSAHQAGEGNKTGVRTDADGKVKSARLGSYGFDKAKGADGKSRVDQVKLPFMTLKRDQNGKMRVSQAGFGNALSFRRGETVTKNADGSTSRKMGGFGLHAAVGIKRDRRQADGSIRPEDVRTRSFMGTQFKGDSNGNLRLSTLNLGVAKIKRAETQTRDADGNISRNFGGLYASDVPIIGLHRSSSGAEGHQTDKVFGINISHEKPSGGGSSSGSSGDNSGSAGGASHTAGKTSSFDPPKIK
ncbi:MAG: hypothetical protein R3Y07_04450 [Eubacteriales bacterium]